MVTERYAVIGNPVRHSRSPVIHAEFARAAGVDLEYGFIECAPDAFHAEVRAFREAGGRGLNVTAPFKLAAFELSEHRSERAVAARSVNTLLFDADGVHGDNFDGIGLVRDLRDNLRAPIAGRRVLVLGAGGAARGILLPLVAENPAEVVVANRTAERAHEVASLAAGAPNVRGVALDDPGDDAFDIVLNATSASMHGAVPTVPAAVFGPGTVAYELAYGLGMTPFLRMAREAGVAHLVDGVGMLVEQAAEAFAWWCGIRPHTGPVIASLKVPLT